MFWGSRNPFTYVRSTTECPKTDFCRRTSLRSKNSFQTSTWLCGYSMIWSFQNWDESYRYGCLDIYSKQLGMGPSIHCLTSLHSRTIDPRSHSSHSLQSFCLLEKTVCGQMKYCWGARNGAFPISFPMPRPGQGSLARETPGNKPQFRLVVVSLSFWWTIVKTNSREPGMKLFMPPRLPPG